MTGEAGAPATAGAILYDGNAGAPIDEYIDISPSPTQGVDQLIVSYRLFGGGTGGGIFSNVAQTIVGGLTMGAADPIHTCSVQAKNSFTGELSAVAVATTAGQTGATISGKTAANTPTYVLAQPAAPLLNSVFNGSASLFIATVPGARSQQVELWENTANNSGTATLVGTATNSGALFLRTGTPGSVKFYWARTKNATDSKFSAFSNPTLVVF